MPARPIYAKGKGPIVRDRTPGWRDSRNVCALSDGDRHLGHVVLKAGLWHAFDATHLDDRRNGFKSLGIFIRNATAKAAVEAGVAQEHYLRVADRPSSDSSSAPSSGIPAASACAASSSSEISASRISLASASNAAGTVSRS
jgi:hypothetical protein